VLFSYGEGLIFCYLLLVSLISYSLSDFQWAHSSCRRQHLNKEWKVVLDINENFSPCGQRSVKGRIELKPTPKWGLRFVHGQEGGAVNTRSCYSWGICLDYLVIRAELFFSPPLSPFLCPAQCARLAFVILGRSYSVLQSNKSRLHMVPLTYAFSGGECENSLYVCFWWDYLIWKLWCERS